MDRLTYRDENGKATRAPMSHAFQVLEILAQYEDAEEQGRLIVLPCKVGDTVWEIATNCGSDEGCVYPRGRCRDCTIAERVIWPHKVTTLAMAAACYERLGETIFLAREAAEAALGGDGE